MIHIIKAVNQGGFTNFVKVGAEVKAEQVLGVVAKFNVPNKVDSPVVGTITAIYLHPDTGGVVEPGDVLYEIEDGIAPEVV